MNDGFAATACRPRSEWREMARVAVYTGILAGRLVFGAYRYVWLHKLRRRE